MLLYLKTSLYHYKKLHFYIIFFFFCFIDTSVLLVVDYFVTSATRGESGKHEYTAQNRFFVCNDLSSYIPVYCIRNPTHGAEHALDFFFFSFLIRTLRRRRQNQSRTIIYYVYVGMNKFTKNE